MKNQDDIERRRVAIFINKWKYFVFSEACSYSTAHSYDMQI